MTMHMTPSAWTPRFAAIGGVLCAASVALAAYASHGVEGDA